MPNLKLTVQLERDGVPVSGFPKIARMLVDEAQLYDYSKADDGDGTTFSTLPTQQLDTINVLVVQPDQQVTLRLDGQSDAGIVINQDGLLILFDVTVDDGSSTNATINNNSGSAANVEGVAGGT